MSDIPVSTIAAVLHCNALVEASKMRVEGMKAANQDPKAAQYYTAKDFFDEATKCILIGQKLSDIAEAGGYI